MWSWLRKHAIRNISLGFKKAVVQMYVFIVKTGEPQPVTLASQVWAARHGQWVLTAKFARSSGEWRQGMSASIPRDVKRRNSWPCFAARVSSLSVDHHREIFRPETEHLSVSAITSPAARLCLLLYCDSRHVSHSYSDWTEFPVLTRVAALVHEQHVNADAGQATDVAA